MNTVTVSPKFQIVIPREIREKFEIRPGNKLQMINFDGRIELVAIRTAVSLKGFIKGKGHSFHRDEEDRR